MHRLCALTIGLVLALPALARADAFDHYTNDILVKIAKGEPVKELTEEMLFEHTNVLPNTKPALIVVKTNDGRLCKLLVKANRQKLPDKSEVPILYIERFVTYKEAEERTIVAEGKNVRLFADFLFNLDLGQVAPLALGGDLKVVIKDDKMAVVPLGKAEIFVLTKHLPEADPKKIEKVIVGPKFEMKYFNGVYQLYDDGRRSGKLVLKVDEDGDVNGHYYSDKNEAKYVVTGRVGDPAHTIKFKIQLPQVSQEFVGWMFTGDGKVISGFSRIQERELGFYAIRVEKND